MTLILMMTGGNSGSTAGGAKTTTILLVLLTAASILKGEENVHIFGQAHRKRPASPRLFDRRGIFYDGHAGDAHHLCRSAGVQPFSRC